MRIRILLNTSQRIRIRIRETKLMRIHGWIQVKLCRHKKKLNFHMKNILNVGNQSLKVSRYESLETGLILINSLPPGSESAFPIRIRIPESQINVDPYPQHWYKISVIPIPPPLDDDSVESVESGLGLLLLLPLLLLLEEPLLQLSLTLLHNSNKPALPPPSSGQGFGS
jgi:hypothetical protein